MLPFLTPQIWNNVSYFFFFHKVYLSIKYRMKKRFFPPREESANCYFVSNGWAKLVTMLSIRICIQIAIAVLHDLSSDNVLQPVHFFLSEGEWKDLLDKLEKGKLIRLLPDKEPGILVSYELCRPLSEISLLDVLQTIHEPTRRNTSASETYSTSYGQTADKIGILKQAALTWLANNKISEW